MELDTPKIDDAVLALLYLGLHDGARAWKGFDWDAMDRLHQAGLISEPRGRAKSVVLTEVGLDRAERPGGATPPINGPWIPDGLLGPLARRRSR